MTEENKPAEAAASAEPTEEHEGIVKPAKKGGGSGSKGKLALIIIFVILILLVVIAFVAKNYLTKQALQSQADYEEICVMLKGEIALFTDDEGRSLHCVSSMFKAKDKNRACTRQADCPAGACIGDMSNTISRPPPADSEDRALIPPVRCSEGIRLLPAFVAETEEVEEEL